MPRRIAAICALTVFAVCLLVGGLQTGNPFTTTVLRALGAMAVTFVVGLFIGLMAQRMLDENVKTIEKNLKNNQAKPPAMDR